MGSNADFNGQVLELLNQLKTKKDRIHKECLDRMAIVDREIEAVSTTLRLLQQPAMEPPVPSEHTKVEIAQLTGKSARAALVEIARLNNGQVVINEAKPILLSAGILKPTKNVWGAIYTTLVRSKEFEKHPTKSGTFVLTGYGQPGLPLN